MKLKSAVEALVLFETLPAGGEEVLAFKERLLLLMRQLGPAAALTALLIIKFCAASASGQSEAAYRLACLVLAQTEMSTHTTMLLCRYGKGMEGMWHNSKHLEKQATSRQLMAFALLSRCQQSLTQQVHFTCRIFCRFQDSEQQWHRAAGPDHRSKCIFYAGGDPLLRLD